MDNLDAIMIIEGEAESQEQYFEAFQALINSGVVWQLQGFYGRTAAALIDEGMCHEANPEHN